jgi:signal transduction histidine kinase
VHERLVEALVHVAREICGTKMAAVSLVDAHRQWFKAKVGLDYRNAPREESFCAHAIPTPDEVMVVQDATRDERFEDNSAVLDDPEIRFYAGAPLETTNGHAVGTLCVLDDEPRNLDENQREALERLSQLVVTTLELRQQARYLERTNEALERANELLEEFTGLVSYELRDSLTGVRSNLEIVEMAADRLDVETRAHLEAALESTDSLETTLEALLDYARGGYGDLQIQPVGLDALVAIVNDEAQSHLEPHDVTVDLESNVRLEADPRLLRRVVENLVTNAAQHAGPGAHVQVRGHETDDGWRIEVEDDGPGIPKGDQAGIFELFARGDETTDGTGVGLALCRRVVERHGGEIGAENVDGGGARFWFTVEER